MSYGLGVDLGTTFTAAAGGNAQYEPAPQAQQTVTVNSPLAAFDEVPPVHRSAARVTHAVSDRMPRRPAQVVSESQVSCRVAVLQEPLRAGTSAAR